MKHMKKYKLTDEQIENCIIAWYNRDTIPYISMNELMKLKDILKKSSNIPSMLTIVKEIKEFREKHWDKTLPLNEAYKKYVKMI